MTTNEASKRWNVDIKEVRRVCKTLGYPKESGKYVIPDEAEYTYVPNKRYKAADKLYLHVGEAIEKKAVIEYRLIQADEDDVKTVVRVLRDANLIELKYGRKKKSLDYRDYVLGLGYVEWKEKKSTQRMKQLEVVAGFVIEQASKGAIEAFMNA